MFMSFRIIVVSFGFTLLRDPDICAYYCGGVCRNDLHVEKRE